MRKNCRSSEKADKKTSKYTSMSMNFFSAFLDQFFYYLSHSRIKKDNLFSKEDRPEGNRLGNLTLRKRQEAPNVLNFLEVATYFSRKIPFFSIHSSKSLSKSLSLYKGTPLKSLGFLHCVRILIDRLCKKLPLARFSITSFLRNCLHDSFHQGIIGKLSTSGKPLP